MYFPMLAALLLQESAPSTHSREATEVCFASGRSGMPLLPCLVGERFAPTSDSARLQNDDTLRAWTARWFPVGSVHVGWTAAGEKRTTRVKSHSFTRDLGVPLVGFDPAVALVSSSSLELHVLPGTASTLTANERISIRDEAQRLWARAIKHLGPDESVGPGFQLGEPTVLAVPGTPGLRAVFLPVTLGAGKDTRGSFFFVVDGNGRITFGRFGHPEWTRGVGADEVAKFIPLFFFRIGSDATTYLLADYAEAWESWGLVAIIDPVRACVVAF